MPTLTKLSAMGGGVHIPPRVLYPLHQLGITDHTQLVCQKGTHIISCQDLHNMHGTVVRDCHKGHSTESVCSSAAVCQQATLETQPNTPSSLTSPASVGNYLHHWGPRDPPLLGTPRTSRLSSPSPPSPGPEGCTTPPPHHQKGNNPQKARVHPVPYPHRDQVVVCH